MATQPGVSFSPLNMDQNGPSGTAAAGSPLQDAIKILSFRMPSVVGAVGSPLAGNPGDSIANDWLMKLFRGVLPADNPPAASATPMGPSSPFAGPAAAPPTFTNSAPPGAPPSSAPSPNVVYTPPDAPKTSLPTPGVIDRTTPDQGQVSLPPNVWRDWLSTPRQM